jgi:hypothetical protein
MDKISLPNEILLGEVAAVLRDGREAVIIPTGCSMLPFIRGGVDRVVLHREPNVAVGDIVLVRIGEHYILHRVFAREGEALTLMGDGNLAGTERCTLADVIGTVTEIIRPSGRHYKPGRGRLWRFLKPVRRYLLGVYRRVVVSE